MKLWDREKLWERANDATRRRRPQTVRLLAWLCLGISACADSGPEERVCIPGETRVCSGDAACSGVQSCQGEDWSACDCSVPALAPEPSGDAAGASPEETVVPDPRCDPESCPKGEVCIASIAGSEQPGCRNPDGIWLGTTADGLEVRARVTGAALREFRAVLRFDFGNERCQLPLDLVTPVRLQSTRATFGIALGQSYSTSVTAEFGEQGLTGSIAPVHSGLIFCLYAGGEVTIGSVSSAFDVTKLVTFRATRRTAAE